MLFSKLRRDFFLSSYRRHFLTLITFMFIKIFTNCQPDKSDEDNKHLGNLGIFYSEFLLNILTLGCYRQYSFFNGSKIWINNESTKPINETVIINLPYVLWTQKKNRKCLLIIYLYLKSKLGTSNTHYVLSNVLFLSSSIYSNTKI